MGLAWGPGITRGHHWSRRWSPDISWPSDIAGIKVSCDPSWQVVSSCDSRVLYRLTHWSFQSPIDQALYKHWQWGTVMAYRAYSYLASAQYLLKRFWMAIIRSDSYFDQYNKNKNICKTDTAPFLEAKANSVGIFTMDLSINVILSTDYVYICFSYKPQSLH